jgi:hypothetical protein
LTLFRHKYSKELYLFQWIDRDTTFNRWLAYSCTLDTFNLFLQKKIALDELFLQGNPHCLIVDINREWEWKNIGIFEKSSLSKNYQPSQNLFFDEIDCIDLAKLNDFVASLLAQKKPSTMVLYPKSDIISPINSISKPNRKLSNTYVSTSY